MYATLTTKELIGGFISDKYPKDVLNGQHWCSIDKSCFLLREALNWTTYRIRSHHYETAHRVVDSMKRVKFPILLSIQGSTSDYLHAVVIWKNQIIDFQNVSRINLTLKNLEICIGSNTRFISVTCGYGLIPSKATRKK